MISNKLVSLDLIHSIVIFSVIAGHFFLIIT